MTSVLLWKEYRQQRAVWIVIALMALLLVLTLPPLIGDAYYWRSFQDDRARSALVWVLVSLMLAYGIVSGALWNAADGRCDFSMPSPKRMRTPATARTVLRFTLSDADADVPNPLAVAVTLGL